MGFLLVKNISKDGNHMVNYDNKFGIPTRSTNRWIFIVEAELPYGHKFGSRY